MHAERVMRHQLSRYRAAKGQRQRCAVKEHADRPRPRRGRIPVGEIIDHARKKAGLGHAQQEADDVIGGRAFHECGRRRDQSPGNHDARQPDPRADAVQDQVGWHFQHRIADKEDRRAKGEGRGADARIGFQALACETHIGPVQEGQHVHHQECGHQIAMQLGYDAGKLRLGHCRPSCSVMGGVSLTTTARCAVRYFRLHRLRWRPAMPSRPLRACAPHRRASWRLMPPWPDPC